MKPHFNLVEGTQTVVPGRDHVWKHTVKESDEPAHSNTKENDFLGTPKTTQCLTFLFFLLCTTPLLVGE